MVTRGERKRADYILYYKANIPIAIIEAKDNNHSIGAGMQQARNYGKMLDIPIVYSSNGDGFLEHDRTKTSGTIERELTLTQFPSPSDLWERYKQLKGIDSQTEETIVEDYYFDQDSKSPRYYQRMGQDRILLVMATGTGKTYTAFQIIYRLWKTKTKKRILFLADRKILVDQTMTNDVAPFGDKMTKIKNCKVDKAHEVYLALYQGISGTEDFQNV